MRAADGREGLARRTWHRSADDGRTVAEARLGGLCAAPAQTSDQRVESAHGGAARRVVCAGGASGLRRGRGRRRGGAAGGRAEAVGSEGGGGGPRPRCRVVHARCLECALAAKCDGCSGLTRRGRRSHASSIQSSRHPPAALSPLTKCTTDTLSTEHSVARASRRTTRSKLNQFALQPCGPILSMLTTSTCARPTLRHPSAFPHRASPARIRTHSRRNTSPISPKPTNGTPVRARAPGHPARCAIMPPRRATLDARGVRLRPVRTSSALTAARIPRGQRHRSSALARLERFRARRSRGSRTLCASDSAQRRISDAGGTREIPACGR